jgi:hypothetical protein
VKVGKDLILMKTTDLGLAKSSRTSRKTLSKVQPQTKATNPNLPTPKPTKPQPYPAETQRPRRTKLDICTEKVLTPRSKHLERLKKIQTKETNPKLPTLKPTKHQPNLTTLATKHAESTNPTKKIALPKPTTHSSKPTRDSARLHLEMNVHGMIQIYETECISQRERKKFRKQENHETFQEF